MPDSGGGMSNLACKLRQESWLATRHEWSFKDGDYTSMYLNSFCMNNGKSIRSSTPP